MPTPELIVPSRQEVAASSRPRQLVVTTLKKKEKSQTGKTYQASKHDSAKISNINWKSPTYWPLIDQVVREQVGKPNLSDIVRTLQDRDRRFEHFKHQRLSDWRDKSRPDKIVWSKKTLQDVEKGFLPGGDITRYDVFVSFLYLVYRTITDDI